MSSRSRGSTALREVVNRHPVACTNERQRDRKTDVTHDVALNLAQSGLAHADSLSRRPLRKAVRSAPPNDLLSNRHHVESDNSQSTSEQGNSPESSLACDSDSVRYSHNMTIRRAKSQKPGSAPPAKAKPQSGSRVRASEDLVAAYREHVKSKGDKSKSLPDDLMKNFQTWLALWVNERCTTDGEPWAQRAIADTLGVTQPEFGSWMRDTARPGISRLVDIRRKTQVSLDNILGLEKLGR